MNAPLRTDLLELTPQALTALANAGFVKRAQKDVAAKVLPRLEPNPTAPCARNSTTARARGCRRAARCAMPHAPAPRAACAATA